MQVTVTGRRRGQRAYVVAPEAPVSAKSVINGIALVLIGLPVLAFLLLVMVVGFGIVTLLIYLFLVAFLGAPAWLAGTITGAVDLFALSVMWVNRR